MSGWSYVRLYPKRLGTSIDGSTSDSTSFLNRLSAHVLWPAERVLSCAHADNDEARRGIWAVSPSVSSLKSAENQNIMLHCQVLIKSALIPEISIGAQLWVLWVLVIAHGKFIILWSPKQIVALFCITKCQSPMTNCQSHLCWMRYKRFRLIFFYNETKKERRQYQII